MNLCIFGSFFFHFWQSVQSGGGSLIPIIFIIAVFVLLIVLVPTIFFFAYKNRQKRIQAMQTFAAQNGWTFVPNSTIQSFQNSDSYSLFNHSHRQIIALLERPHDGGEALVFDYTYRVSHGKNHHHYQQTIFAFHTPHLQLPYFALYPESFFSFVGEMFGYNDIDFASHPAFSKQFKLTGRDEMQIRSVFHPQALSFFENLPNIRIDAGGNYLFVYVHNSTVKPENLNAFLKTALDIYNLFRR